MVDAAREFYQSATYLETKGSTNFRPDSLERGAAWSEGLRDCQGDCCTILSDLQNIALKLNTR